MERKLMGITHLNIYTTKIHLVFVWSMWTLSKADCPSIHNFMKAALSDEERKEQQIAQKWNQSLESRRSKHVWVKLWQGRTFKLRQNTKFKVCALLLNMNLKQVNTVVLLLLLWKILFLLLPIYFLLLLKRIGEQYLPWWFKHFKCIIPW